MGGNRICGIAADGVVEPDACAGAGDDNAGVLSGVCCVAGGASGASPLKQKKSHPL